MLTTIPMGIHKTVVLNSGSELQQRNIARLMQAEQSAQMLSLGSQIILN